MTELTVFKAISNFVSDMNDAFGNAYKPLRLYARLVNKTPISNSAGIEKHISIFKDFCFQNREAICSKSTLSQKMISFSERVYIDMEHVFKLAGDEKTEIWDHLLTISALVDPESKAREVLKAETDSVSISKNDTQSEDFMEEMMKRVEKSVKPGANPMEAISSLLQSGIVTDLISNLQSGKLDIGKMLGSMQSMMGQQLANGDGDPETAQAMNMMSGILNPGTNSSGIDLSAIMKMMNGLNLSQNQSSQSQNDAKNGK